MRRALLPTLFLLLPFAPAIGAQEASQESSPFLDLNKAYRLFAVGDADDNGRVSLREAVAAGHSLDDFRFFDADGDGFVDQEEFLVGYVDKVKARGARIDPELQGQIDRIKRKLRTRGAGDLERRGDAVPSRTPAAARRAEAPAGASPNAPSSARARAAAALADLRARSAPDLAAARTRNAPGRDATGTDAANENVAGRDARASAPSRGPASRRLPERVSRSATDLGRLLQERRRAAAEEGREDPRFERARRRASEARRGRTGGTTRRGGAIERDGRSNGGLRRGGLGGRRGGPAAGRGRSGGVRSRGGS